jgi:hypothetical protein
LAQLVLQIIKEGRPVPAFIALQLRNWASHPQDASLSLEEIARHIVSQEEDPI